MSLSWAERKRAAIVTVIGAAIIAVLAIVAFSIFYEVPTCFDRKQNQDEAGVDCGGSCTTLCVSQVREPLSVRFARAIASQPGRTDVIAYVDNPNEGATARRASFTLDVFGADGIAIAKRTITVDVPAAMTRPVYLPDVAPRGSVAAQAFLTPEAENVSWEKAGPASVLPMVEEILVQEGEQPRVTATLRNPLAVPFYDTVLIATIFDGSGTAIAASQTLVPSLTSQGTSPVVFTWNAPFAAPVARVEILPIISLSSR